MNELEPQAVDVIKPKISLPMYTVGPLVPHFKLGDTSISTRELQGMICQLVINKGSVRHKSRCFFDRHFQILGKVLVIRCRSDMVYCILLYLSI